jgi:uncharacterized membrane protein
MDLRRLFKHLLTTRARVARHFPPAKLNTIKRAITASERTHRGEIRLVIEAALDPVQVMGNMTPRERALEVFSHLRVWDTRDNSGVLIYVLFADRAIEIIADRGIDAHSGSAVWERIAANVLTAFSAGDFLAGALVAITAVSEQLRHHVPHQRDGEGELPNHVTML